jgi:tRNA(Arg) A34 adenosine deaminase TadA/nucleoside 2-deoxyribosyltransferase
MPAKQVYLAGPEVFLPRAQALEIAAEKKAICASLGMLGVFPFDLEVKLPDNDSSGEDWGARMARAIAQKDETLVRTCDAVIANVTPFRSPSAGVGTVYEVGYARGLGKPVFGYTNDHRPYAARVLGSEPQSTAKYDLDGSARTAVCDTDGLTVEPFGCSDNLMLHSAFLGNAGPVVADSGSAGGCSIASLAAFRLAAEKAAKYLLEEPNEIPTDADFMREAIGEATAAMEAGNHPFGAVLVVDGAVVLRGGNAVVTENDATRHAELVLVSAASKTLSRDVLAHATLVTSTAPCPMCSGAIYWAGIGRVVYGCPAEVLGRISGEELDVCCRKVMSAGVLHSVDVVGPVLPEECAEQHREFWPRFIAQGNSVV